MMNSLFRLTNLMSMSRKVPIGEEEGLIIYPAEQNFMCLLHEKPECNMTELAELQGVTKGAVSQMAKKLETKGILERVKSHNKKIVYLRLTSLGLDTFEKIDSKKESRESNLCSIWDQYDEAVIDQFSEIMDKMAGFFKEELK